VLPSSTVAKNVIQIGPAYTHFACFNWGHHTTLNNISK
jgi:hypothetical protein